MNVERVPLESLVADPANVRRHGARNMQAIQGSLRRFGQQKPIVIDGDGVVRAGNGTLAAAKALGWTEIDVVRTELTGAEAAAFAIADNRTAELAEWEDAQLVRLLEEVGLEGTGFSDDDLAELLDATREPTALIGDADDVPEEPNDADIYVEPGDLWQLGDHRLLCADCTLPENVARVLDGQLADICFTDAPYNVAIGEKSGRHDDMANDDLGDAFPGFCTAFAASIKQATKPGAPLYLAMSSQEWPTIDLALRTAGFHWSTTIIWAKDTFVLSRGDFHRQYEPLWYGWNADAPRLHPVEDRKQSDVWQIARPKKSESHPSIKPIELVERALLLSSNRGDLVFEPFAGSFSTGIACEQTGRKCAAIELSPKYAQLCIERWQMLTGRKAEKIGGAP